MKREQIPNILYLLLTAAIWGFAFVAQSVGNAMGSFTFNCIRSFIGALVLLPVIALRDRLLAKESGSDKSQTTQNGGKWTRELLLVGMACGVLLCLGSNLQQVGLNYTTAGKAGFITAFYIVLVPIAGLFLKRKCPFTAFVGVALSLIGLFLLCIPKGATFGLGEMKGDLIVLMCAFAFTAQIWVIDLRGGRLDGVRLACIEFLVCGLISMIPMLLFEHPTWEKVTSEPIALLYAGVLSCGVAYTLQIFGQRNMNPTVCSLIMSLESAFAVLGGALILKEHMGGREAFGCIFMFAAIVLAQLPSRKKEKESEQNAG